MIDIALVLILLHTVDGREIVINPKHITYLTAAKKGRPNELVVEGVNCIVSLSDGKYLSVAETCDYIRELMERIK